MDLGLLKQMLVWVLTGGGAGAVAYALWELVKKWFPVVKEWPAETERVVTLVLSGVIALGAYFLSIWLGYQGAPSSQLEWLESVIAVLGMVYPVSQMIHVVKKARGG